MDMRRLEVFCKVVELKSFTKAGEALLLAQPTVSEHLRTLEDMLGEKLVDRLGPRGPSDSSREDFLPICSKHPPNARGSNSSPGSV